jgi:hypothetical protein
MCVAITNYDTWAAQEWGSKPATPHPNFYKVIKIDEMRRKYTTY